LWAAQKARIKRSKVPYTALRKSIKQWLLLFKEWVVVQRLTDTMTRPDLVVVLVFVWVQTMLVSECDAKESFVEPDCWLKYCFHLTENVGTWEDMKKECESSGFGLMAYPHNMPEFRTMHIVRKRTKGNPVFVGLKKVKKGKKKGMEPYDGVQGFYDSTLKEFWAKGQFKDPKETVGCFWEKGELLHDCRPNMIGHAVCMYDRTTANDEF